jgi:PAS domain S-box-containing protein
MSANDTDQPLAQWSIHLKLGKLEWDAGMYQLLDVDKAAAADMRQYFNRLDDGQRQEVEQRLQQAIVQGDGFSLTQLLTNPSDASRTQLRLVVACDKDANQSPVLIRGSFWPVDTANELDSRLFEIIARSVDAGILILDSNQQIAWINPSFTALTGYLLTELQNDDSESYLQRLFQPALVAATVLESFQAALRSGDEREDEIAFVDKFGTHRWLHIRLQPYIDFTGNLAYYLWVIHDITARKQAEAEMISLNIALQEKNDDIHDSLLYAKRVQLSLLPDLSRLTAYQVEPWMFFQPKDVVSGDFYWLHTTSWGFWFAVADATGHGVPGAIIALLCARKLSEAMTYADVETPADALNRIHIDLELVFRGSDEIHGDVSDGMDVTLLRYDMQSRELQYAGANRTLIQLRGGISTEHKGDKQSLRPNLPFGYSPFQNQVINIEAGDKLVLSSDGIQDQFGAVSGATRKYSRKRLMDVLTAHSMEQGTAIIQALQSDLQQWQGQQSQTDDMLLVGLTFH